MKPNYFPYNKKEEKYQATKERGETTYYLGVAKICPKCKNYIQGYPALSRKDNRTEICSQCGVLEALEVFINYNQNKKKEIKQKNDKRNNQKANRRSNQRRYEKRSNRKNENFKFTQKGHKGTKRRR